MKIVCKICGHSGLDISSHIRLKHNISIIEYREKYKCRVVSPEIDKKRKETTKKLYGDPNWRNKDAQKLMFSDYKGGHPFKDPECRKKACKTKERLYGDPNYTNREKAKKTNLERYGTEHTGASEQVIEKRIKTLKSRYGKVFNVEVPYNKTKPPKNFKEVFIFDGLTYDALSSKYEVSIPTIKRWVEELCLKREPLKSSKKIYESPEEVVSKYLDACYELSKPLSFYDYGKIKGEKYSNKLKRLFNKGKKFEHLKPLLSRAAADQSLKHRVLYEMGSSL